jgi:hypothetical protein
MKRPTMPGKDGKPFDLARYVHWGKRGTSSLKFQRMKHQKKIRRAKWFCKCGAGPFRGAGIKKHRDGRK